MSERTNLSAIIGSATTAATGSACYSLRSPAYGGAVQFGNVEGSFTFSGSGNPADIYAPVVMYMQYGKNDGTNGIVAKTTQAFFSAAVYFGPTTDDSMECGSCFVAAKNTGKAYTQSRAVTAFEGHAQVEGKNKATNNVIGVASRISLTEEAETSGPAYGFRASTPEKAAGATFSEYIAFGDAGAAGGAVLNFGVKVHDQILSETALKVGSEFQARVDGTGGGTPAFTQIEDPAGKDIVTLRLNAISTQTKPIISCFDTSGNQRFVVSATGFPRTEGANFLAQNSSAQTMVIISGQNGAVQLGNNSGGTGTTAAQLWSGSGAPSKPGNNSNPVAGDWYFRTDKPTGAKERLYICTTGGASPVWEGVV